MTDDIIDFNFNQIKNCFILLFKDKYLIYSLDPLKLLYKRKHDFEKVKYLNMYFETNVLIFVIEDNNKDKLILWDDSKQNKMAEIIISTKIKKILLRKDYLIIVTFELIYIYNFKDLSLFKKYETLNNTGICTVTIKKDFIIIFPAEKIGYFKIKNITKNTTKLIKGHDSSINYLTISEKYISSVSTNGTIIRIYDLNGKLIHEFRRGIEKTFINWLSFGIDNNIILCHSKRGTIHLFETQETYFNKFLSFFNNRSIAKFHFKNIKTISIIKKDILYVISEFGFFYKINYKDKNDFINVKKKKLFK